MTFIEIDAFGQNHWPMKSFVALVWCGDPIIIMVSEHRFFRLLKKTAPPASGNRNKAQRIILKEHVGHLDLTKNFIISSFKKGYMHNAFQPTLKFCSTSLYHTS
jgi:hypothetical protein